TPPPPEVEPEEEPPGGTAEKAAEGGIALAAARAPRTPAKVRLRVVPAALGVTAGDRFDLRIEADAKVPLSHLPMVVAYNGQVLEAVSWVRGPLLGGEGEAELLGAVGQPGRLLLGASRLGQRPGVTGSGTVAVITFEAKKAGTANVRLDRPKALGPGLENLQPVTASNAKVIVTAPEAADAVGDETAAESVDRAVAKGPHA